MLVKTGWVFEALLYRNGFNWLVKDKFGLGVDSVGYLTSYQGAASFVSSFFANLLIERYADRTTCLLHVAVLLGVAYAGLLGSLFLSTYTAFLLLFVTATSLLRVLLLDLTIQRCSRVPIPFLPSSDPSLSAGSRRSGV